MLENHIFSDTLRYESHSLIYTPANEEPIVLTGFLGAAFLGALLVDTEEGNERAIAIDSPEQSTSFFLRYDREVRRDDWGYLDAEILQLRDSYVQIALAESGLIDICPNIRLLNLAMTLLTDYMHYLVLETYCEHIWEYVPWERPFAQWLWNAAHEETLRQRYLHTDWSDPAIVTELADQITLHPTPYTLHPTLLFEGERATDIMDRYLQWLSDDYVARKQERPGAKITSADRNRIFRQETDTSSLNAEIASLDASAQKQWNQWMIEWNKFLSEQLGPQQEIQFWANDVSESVREHLLYHLQLMESHPARFRDLTTAIYAMRQLGYIRRKLSDKAMRQWLSEHLQLDYTERNNASQFQRAMKDHGRYTPEVRSEVLLLESIGIRRYQVPEPE